MSIEPSVQRPPLGLMPKHLWSAQVDKDRLNQIQEALIRYIKVEEKIPQDWVDEYNDITTRRKK